MQQQQLNANNTVPLDIRPLRMSVRLRCTTTNLNIGGEITCVLVPQSLATTYSSASVFSTATATSLWNLVQSDPRSKSIANLALVSNHTFVMPPSSFIAYNSYKDFIPLSLTSDNLASITTADFEALYGTIGLLPTFPYTPQAGFVNDIPTNFVLLINIPPNSMAQNYDLEVYCQDAVRYPANSMAASVSQSHVHPIVLTDADIQRTSVDAGNDFVGISALVDSAGSVASGALGSRIGGAAGAAMGSAFGPPGVAAGTMAGSFLGGYGGSAMYRASRKMGTPWQ